MAEVAVHPGGVVIEHKGDTNTWSFTVTVDGKVGVMACKAPDDWSEDETRAVLQEYLEKNPKKGWGGVASTDGNQGEETSTGDGDTDDDDEDDDGDDDTDDDDDEGDDDDDGDSSGDEDESGSGEEGDGVGDRRREERIAAAVAHGLAVGVLTWKNEGDEDTGPRHEERLAILIAKVTSREVVIPGHDIDDGLGDDTGDINHERLAALVARALARGGLVGPPDDGGDGDGTGRPLPTFGHIVLG